jgi:hypothetical protein
MGKKLLVMVASCLFSSVVFAQINWEITNRFPLVSERAFTAIVEEVGAGATDIEQQLTQVDYRNKVRHLDGSSAWSAKNQRYDASQLLSPDANIRARSTLGSQECVWTLTDDETKAILEKSGACDSGPSFPVRIGKSYEIKAQRIADLVSLSTKVMPKRWLVIALGDSFTSGEGNPDYPTVIKEKFSNQPPHDWAVDSKYSASAIVKASAKWFDTDCHRSILSWPAIYALRKALTQSDTVVQFASFACSGGEIIDGFILPQRNPPGRMGPEVGGADTRLAKSQQRMLAELLCDNQQLSSVSKEFEPILAPYLQKYKSLYAKATLWDCQQPVRPDEVFVQFGGNDALFAGIVKYVFQPAPLTYRGFGGWFIGSGVNFGLYKVTAPVTPQQAQMFIDLLPSAYAWLDRGLSVLGIESKQLPIRMLQYPDPTRSALPEADHPAEFLSCNLRTRDANQPIQSLIADQLSVLRHGSAFAGASGARLVEVRTSYIPSLRLAQSKAANAFKWELPDASPAFVGRGLCAGSLECDMAGEKCPNADRVRWGFWQASDKYVASKLSPAWEQMSDFKAYDVERKRGIRYANDALLSSARLAPGGKRLRTLCKTHALARVVHH